MSEAARRGRDAPCPICGGRDRFRFSNKDGLGLWYCHGCGEGGDGVKLVMLAKGVDFKGAAKLIDGVLGNPGFYSPGASAGNGGAAHNTNGGNGVKDVLRSWREAYPAIRGTTVEAYLRGRGLTDRRRGASPEVPPGAVALDFQTEVPGDGRCRGADPRHWE
jgi:putative DNA primase/helicase